VRPGAEVEASLVANGSRVAGRVRNSILFPGVSVGPGAEVVDSVIMSDVRIGSGARVANAILDKYARVGEGAAIGADEVTPDPELAWLEGLTLVGKDAVIPDGARVGRQVVLGVGAGPADFRENEIRANTRVPNRPAFAGHP
jgi:glucose-1-phosphate adenylyltransferase